MSIIYTADLGEAQLDVDTKGLFCVLIKLYSDDDSSIYAEFETIEGAEDWIRLHINYPGV